MRLSHARRAIGVRFDDPNLVSCSGLVPIMALVDRCGLPGLLHRHVKISATGGTNTATKLLAIIAGLKRVAGAPLTPSPQRPPRRLPATASAARLRRDQSVLA